MTHPLPVNTTVYVPSIETKAIPVTCPDCDGRGTWTVIMGRRTAEVTCPRCQGKTNSEYLTPRRFERVLKVTEHVIAEATVRQRRDHVDKATVRTTIDYSLAPYSGNTRPESVFLTREEAESRGAELLIEDEKREHEEWRKNLKLTEERAGMDIVWALQARADKTSKEWESKVNRLREKLLEAVAFPSLYGPEIKRDVLGVYEVKSQSLAAWFNGLLEEAGIDTLSEEEIHEATCHC